MRKFLIILIVLAVLLPTTVHAERFFFEEDSEINIEYEGDGEPGDIIADPRIKEEPVILQTKEIKLRPVFGLSILPKGELVNRPWSFL